MKLISGQNTLITAKSLQVQLHHPNNINNLILDSSVFLLNAQQKVTKDEDFIFFNNPNRQDIGIIHFSEYDKTQIDLTKIPKTIQKIVFTLTISNGVNKRQSFQQLSLVSLTIHDSTTNKELLSFNLDTQNCTETALIIGELYQRQEQWKFRAIGQGFKGGLQPLAELYGVDISEGEDNQNESMPKSQSSSIENQHKPAPKKITTPIDLKKRGEKTIICLEKGAKVTACLKWETDADLDLYCFYVDDTDHEDKVYYRKLGSLTKAPYVQLLGDSLNAGEETVEISRPDKLRYALIAAYSALSNGVGSFYSYKAKCVVTDNQGQIVTTHLAHKDPFSYWVALARIDFTKKGQLTIENVETYSSKKLFIKEFQRRTGEKPEGLFHNTNANVNGVKTYDPERCPHLFKNGSFMMSVGVREFKS